MKRGPSSYQTLEDPEFGSGYIVLGMGKLGAQELNYSSDVDLIVVYDPEVISTTAPLKLQQNLVRLTRDLVQLLSERTEDGYVFGQTSDYGQTQVQPHWQFP